MLTTNRALRVEPTTYETADFTVPQYGELIDAIYRGPLEASPWSSALEALRTLLGANAATLMLRPPTFDRPGSMFNMPPQDTRARNRVTYNSYYHSLDPFVDLPFGVVTTVDAFLGTKTWCESDLYRDLLQRMDYRYVLGADIETDDGIACRFRLCRSHDSTDFSERDKAMCAVLMPHFKRAVDLYSRVDAAESECALFESAVDRMLVGMVVLDDEGVVLKANSVAKRILAENDGIRLRNGKFELSDSRERSRFRALVQRAIDSIAMDAATHGTTEGKSAAPMVEAMSIERPLGRTRLGLLTRAIPVNEWSEEKKWCPACVVFIRDPASSSQTSIDILRQLFDFTPTEASLALLMANGYSLEEAAQEFGVKTNTARAHLRAIFSKAGVTRQAELVRTLLNSVMSLG